MELVLAVVEEEDLRPSLEVVAVEEEVEEASLYEEGSCEVMLLPLGSWNFVSSWL